MIRVSITQVDIVKLIGREEHLDNIRNAFVDTGERAVNALHEIITTGERSGRSYIRNGQHHVASAPGEAPANMTGRLANSFDCLVTDNELSVYSTATSDSGANYAVYLEEGTSKMAPRPYFKRVNEQQAIELAAWLGRLADE